MNLLLVLLSAAYIIIWFQYKHARLSSCSFILSSYSLSSCSFILSSSFFPWTMYTNMYTNNFKITSHGRCRMQSGVCQLYIYTESSIRTKENVSLSPLYHDTHGVQRREVVCWLCFKEKTMSCVQARTKVQLPLKCSFTLYVKFMYDTPNL